MNELYREIANALAESLTLTVRKDALASVVMQNVIVDVAEALVKWDDEFVPKDFVDYVNRRGAEIYMNV